MIQDILKQLKTESVRSDFLNNRNGACPVNKAEMDFIEKFSQQVVPVRPNFSNEPSFGSAAKASAEVFSFLVDERNREFQDSGFTFEKGKELFNRIQTCGYWEKDVKYVEILEENRAASSTLNTNEVEDDLEISENVGMKKVAAPAPAQVPVPTFNGNASNMMSSLPSIPSNAPKMKTTVTAVENAYFNQIKYSQQSSGHLQNNAMPISAPNQTDFSTNFSFLQDSELDSPAGATGSQHQLKMPVNVIQPQQFKNTNFHPQSPIAVAAGQMYPPGLKVQQSQNAVSHIPVNYQASQQNAVPTSQVPSHLQQHQPLNGNQNPGYGTHTSPITQQPSRPTPGVAQYQQKQSAKSVDQKTDGADDYKINAGRENDKVREEYQEQPQIDTWTNETAQTGGNGNYSSRSSGGGFSRNNRTSTGGAKYNNYR